MLEGECMTKRVAGEPLRSRGKSIARPSDDAIAQARSVADTAFIEALAETLRQNDLAEIEITREYGEDDALHVRLSRYAAQTAPAIAPAAPPSASVQAVVPFSSPSGDESGAPPAIVAPTSDTANCVTSPMVGTIYLAAEPGAANFVSVGDKVAEGQVLLIIEAMKTMNQIPSPKSGIVKQILVENAQPIEFDAPLLIIE